MGARHSLQSQVDQRRMRSNSAVESTLQPPGPSRRTISHIDQARHHSERETPDDPEDDDVILPNAGHSHSIPGSDGNFRTSMRTHAVAGSSPSNAQSSSSNNRANERRTLIRLLAGKDVECPVCHKRVPSDDVEVHLVMCFTRPKLIYNEEVLTTCRGECSICLDDMEVAQTVARLECLCLFHKSCLDEWFKRKNVCPQHPGDE